LPAFSFPSYFSVVFLRIIPTGILLNPIFAFDFLVNDDPFFEFGFFSLPHTVRNRKVFFMKMVLHEPLKFFIVTVGKNFD
jgi:hypothetical protein